MYSSSCLVDGIYNIIGDDLHDVAATVYPTDAGPIFQLAHRPLPTIPKVLVAVCNGDELSICLVQQILPLLENNSKYMLLTDTMLCYPIFLRTEQCGYLIMTLTER